MLNSKDKKRIENLQDNIPRKWLPKFLMKYPLYDNYAGINKVRNVFYGKVKDENILNKLEGMIK